MRSVTSLWLEGYAREQPSLVLFEQLPHSSRRAAAERTERAGFTYSPARGVVAAPLLQRMSPALKTLAGKDEAIEAMGDLRELLDEEDLLLPDDGTR